MKRNRVPGILAVVAIAVVIITASFYFMGYGRNAANGEAGTLTQSGLNAVNATSEGVMAAQGSDTIYINESAGLPVLMGPMNVGSMYSFEILGLVNPEIVIHAGVSVTFTAVNVDNDSSHNFVLSSNGPPYGYMGGPGMMSQGGYMYMMQYLGPESAGHYYCYNFTYTFSHTGTFWYLCTYPGHAEQGMYGRILVES